MDFWKTMGVLLRRWYVSVPIFVVSLVLGGGVFFVVPTQYESTGTLVLTAPTSGGVTVLNPKDATTGPGNPLLDFQGSLTITTQLLIQSLSSPTAAQNIQNQGGSGTFQAGDGQTGGPFVVIIADAPSRAEAQKTVSLALRYASDELDQRQKALDAPATTFIVTQVVVSPTPATTKIGSKVKAGGIALAAGLVLGLAAAFAWESVAGSRRRKTGQDTETDIDDEPYPDDDLDVEDGIEATHKMRPAPPPRQLPQPVRNGVPRTAARPPVGSSGGRREPYGPGPMPMPMQNPQHPAKPRVHPAPVPGGSHANGSGNGATDNGSPTGKPTGKPNGAVNGRTNGTVNGSVTNHDWPRAEFRSPDKPNG